MSIQLNYFFLHPVYFVGNVEFLISIKTFFIDKTRIVSKKWLVNNLVLPFWAKVCQSAIQSDNSFKSYRTYKRLHVKNP